MLPHTLAFADGGNSYRECPGRLTPERRTDGPGQRLRDQVRLGMSKPPGSGLRGDGDRAHEKVDGGNHRNCGRGCWCRGAWCRTAWCRGGIALVWQGTAPWGSALARSVVSGPGRAASSSEPPVNMGLVCGQSELGTTSLEAGTTLQHSTPTPSRCEACSACFGGVLGSTAGHATPSSRRQNNGGDKTTAAPPRKGEAPPSNVALLLVALLVAADRVGLRREFLRDGTCNALIPGRADGGIRWRGEQ